MAVSVQHYLNKNGLNWKLVDGPDFTNFRIVFDNIMKEIALQNIGTTKRQAQYIT